MLLTQFVHSPGFCQPVCDSYQRNCRRVNDSSNCCWLLPAITATKLLLLLLLAQLQLQLLAICTGLSPKLKLRLDIKQIDCQFM